MANVRNFNGNLFQGQGAAATSDVLGIQGAKKLIIVAKHDAGTSVDYTIEQRVGAILEPAAAPADSPTGWNAIQVFDNIAQAFENFPSADDQVTAASPLRVFEIDDPTGEYRVRVTAVAGGGQIDVDYEYSFGRR